MYQYWKHRTSGEIFIARVNDDGTHALCDETVPRRLATPEHIDDLAINLCGGSWYAIDISAAEDFDIYLPER